MKLIKLIQFCDWHTYIVYEISESPRPKRLSFLVSVSWVQVSIAFSVFVTSGQKFPSKTLELSLQATLTFPEYSPPPSSAMSEDPFCEGLNAYADVSSDMHGSFGVSMA